MMSTEGYGVYLVIALMALVMLFTRFGGVFITGLLPLRPRVMSFIDAMSGSVLVAVLVPIAVEADMAGRLGMLATAGVMLLTARPMAGVSLGILVTALIRFGGMS
ncbi:AzlD family protein [Chromatocurvus halotolerans]|uniref:Putative membrane protein n=1 Tax=Chromatocurvus halotolerans TaxID=1132028 RepID=A0A4R2KW79_9GAMM|nr:AzlD domain-containing protein [Chromatocurvus halotolerans]TCO77097.1 putative membrane protein [Chromatocurvus halotolerans]